MDENSISLENIQELDVNEIKEVFEYTSVDQAIMLVGIHGIGKSEFVKKYFEEKGYKVVMLFLGQMADAGDLIGLPDRTEVTFQYGNERITQKITEFCPPAWWPRNDDEKLLLFLDEFNRGKQEVYQCIMDMALNRQLNGLKLPKETRIIAAINPLDDKFGYQVTELDPALFDRFNVYGFSPTRKDWVYWAIDNKINKNIIAFIIKFGSIHLDPPSNGKMGVVYPSRRSWVRLSNILNNYPNLLSEDDFIKLRNIASGIIGQSANSAFYAFLKEHLKGVHPGKIITDWNDDLEAKIKTLSNQDILMLNAEIAMHIEEEEEQYFGNESSSKDRERYAYNLWLYLKTLPNELRCDFYDYIGEATVQHKKTWPSKLLDSNISGLVEDFIDMIHGKSKEDKENEKHFGKTNLDDIIGDL